MIWPILACDDPYETAQTFVRAGWKLDFSQPPESGDPLAGVSLFDNALLLGITSGYVEAADKPHIGCGIELYMSVPPERLTEIRRQHESLHPTEIQLQLWGKSAFEVRIGQFEFMIASE